ncbi:hypothetical protein GobsT_29340 [Gemmata obscuriglobus]|uniref:Uncharacterized protein n=1 Tax=Gemmata obscuriglobus TaxID=114 RepID=A0A2Z3HC87_9BACT|nr:hypothetical protein [Gemmata obscuriglobus]AWM38840.1 hypothetical protein C1280_18875 [Gemmata obscuriglobus]QEG28160.1 hypothetical protein GobsT_29340 [Gemmata obscuriglobus]VTS05856.1 unnamed protein product [Gemmata obscuriglobus UQM 2246]
MSDRAQASQFWQSVLLRLILIWLLGWGTIVWFRGCLVPATRDELREDHRKALPPEPPSPSGRASSGS